MTRYLESVSITLTTATNMLSSGPRFSWNEIIPGEPLVKIQRDSQSGVTEKTGKTQGKIRKVKK
jgi:hypothetical protein